MDNKLDQFKDAVKRELKKAERGYKYSKKAALEIAASAAASPSQSGDRFHSQAASDLAKSRYEDIKKLFKEIESKGEEVIVNHAGEILVLVDHPVLIPGFKIVSTKSPFGVELLSKDQ